MDQENEDKTSIKEIMTNNKKLLIFLLVISVAIAIVLFLNRNNNDDEAFILLSNNYIIQVNDGKYSLVDRKNELPSAVLKNRLRVFYNDEFLGNYKLDNEIKMNDDDPHFYFTDGKKSFSFLTPNIAMSQNVKYIGYEMVAFSDEDFDVLKNDVGMYWVEKKSDLSYAKKIILDFNSDGKEEVLYFATFVGSSVRDNSVDDGEVKYEKPVFSVVYMNIDDEIIIVEESTVSNSSQVLYFYDIAFIIDVFGDGVYEFIISSTYYDIPDYIVYDYNNGSYDMALAVE